MAAQGDSYLENQLADNARHLSQNLPYIALGEKLEETPINKATIVAALNLATYGCIPGYMREEDFPIIPEDKLKLFIDGIHAHGVATKRGNQMYTELRPCLMGVNASKLADARLNPSDKPLLVSIDNYVLGDHAQWLCNMLSLKKRAVIVINMEASAAIAAMKLFLGIM